MTTRKAHADRAEGAFKPAERIALADHHAAAEAVRDKTVRLRAQRLAKEAADDGASRSDEPAQSTRNQR
jgi:hypothetical protein